MISAVPARNAFARAFGKPLAKPQRPCHFWKRSLPGIFALSTPQRQRRCAGFFLASLAYFVVPLDFIPDIILGLGFTDDVAVLMAALTAIRTNITPAHRAAARKALEDFDRGGSLGD